MSTNADASTQESIAVIGMKGRFPGADSIEKLWQNLLDGVESITTFSEREMQAAGIDPSYVNIAGYVNRGSVLESIDLFDAAFFGYSARDAETIDPQQRIFLECAWECLEDAGYNPETYPGMIGVFAGSDQSSYLYQIYSNVDLSAYGYGGMMAIGNEKDYLATQLSYKLNLRGPSLNIQTSCSTSLVTVCMACQSLVHHYCDMALAGGVAISVPQKKGYWYSPGGIVSPDGHCRPFDANGQGTVVGNGVGIVLLKRLSDALADGDRIDAVIKGFALNNDGSAKVGYTAPSVDGQAQVISMAQRMAGAEPDTIGYIEAHGTATALGDPIEIAALSKVFRQRTNKRQFCAIGSLKSNVGHLSSAAGIAGLIKGILAVKHGKIPKSLHYEHPNPEIKFAESPFFVPSELMDWPINGVTRRAGVSSFGVGGTNAHVVLEEAPAPATGTGASDKQLLVLSARTATALEKVTDNLVAYLDRKPDLDLADVAFTCQVGRKAFSHRRCVVFDRADGSDLRSALQARDPQRMSTAHTETQDRKVVFMFAGQGTQHVGMGLDLYRTEPTFRAHVDACSEVLKSQIGLDLREVVFAPQDSAAAAELLKQTEFTQPALFVIEYALAQLWMEWGVRPNAMLGHSIGEYVAACIAGVMSLEDALAVVAMRGRLMGSMPGGSMLAVPLPEAAVQPMLGPAISLAAVNAPAMCVLAGPSPAIDMVERELAARNMPASRLHTSHAFHSSMMDPVLEQFTGRLRQVALKPPRIPYLSNVTGSWMTPELATSPEYWAAHLRQTVRFADNLCEAMAFPDLAMVEVGPGHTLSMLARHQGSRATSHLFVSSLRSVHEQTPDATFIRESLGKLWLGGVRVDWRGMHRHETRRIVSLPTYPFERQRFWLGPIEAAELAPAKPAAASAASGVTVTASAVATAAAMGTAPSMAPATAAAADVSGWFAVPIWKPALPNGGGLSPDGSWLVFADAEGIGAAVAQRLRATGVPVAMVVRGDAYSAADGDYRIRAGNAADYDALLQDLTAGNRRPTHVLHLWSVDPPPPGLAAVAGFDEAQERSFYSVILLAKSLVKLGPATPIQIGIVTDRLQSVLGDEALRSAEATVTGAAKVVPQEYPHLRCRLIDVVTSQPKVSDALVDELASQPFEPVVAYRNGRRWVQAFEPLPLGSPDRPPALLKDGGVYLITGGMGNIGMILAETIARDVKAKLVLTSRTALPPREQWTDQLGANGHDKVGSRIRQVQALEKLGAEVMVVAADAGDRAQMAAMVATVRQNWGAITGVIHGAANLSPDAFAPIKQIDQRNGHAHFQPKDHGLLLLEELLADQPPDWWLLLSSISAVLGGLGLASYAAANAFLDAEAQRVGAAQSARWISVNWDAWDFSARAGAAGGAITAGSGGDAFRRILAAATPQVVVSTTSLDARLRQWVRLETVAPPLAPAAAAAGQAAAPSSNGKGQAHARPELSTPYVAPRNDDERAIAEVWQHFLGVEPIGIHDKFFELGGHSLLAIQLLARLREVFAMDLPVQRIFEAPTVAALAQTIERDRATAAAVTPQAEAGGDLEQMLSLVESLSEEEVEALLNETQSIEQMRQRHAGA